MTTLLIVRTDRIAWINEVLESMIEAEDELHVLKCSENTGLEDRIQQLLGAHDLDIEYHIEQQTGECTSEAIIETLLRTQADRICLEISDRTSTGKVQIDDLTESILLHDGIAGDVLIGDHTVVLEKLRYQQRD